MSKKNEARKTLNIRLEKLPHVDKVNKWLDCQANITDSVVNLVLHMIEKHGYRDVLDFDIQRELHLFQLNNIEAADISMTNKIIDTPISSNQITETNKIDSVDDTSTTESIKKETIINSNKESLQDDNDDDDDDDFPDSTNF